MEFSNLSTKRLILSSISEVDREFIFSQYSNEDVCQFLYDAEPFVFIEEADDLIDFYINGEPKLQHRWVIKRKSDGLKLGTCGFHCWDKSDNVVEIGYDLKREYWGKKYMFEALNEILRYLSEYMNVKTVFAEIFINNFRSINLVKNLGFEIHSKIYLDFNDKKYLHNRYFLNLP